MKKASKSTDVKNTNQDQYMAAVQQDWRALKDVPEGLRDKKLCLAAVQQDWGALDYVPEAVKNDNPDIYLAAVQQNGWTLEFVPEAVQLAHPEICLAAVQNSGLALPYVPEKLRDEKMCLAAVQNSGLVLYYVPEAIKLDKPEICLAAVQNSGGALQFVPESLKTNVKALAKLYTTSEAQLRSDLTLLQIHVDVINQVICSLKAPIAKSSSMMEQLLGTGNDSKQPAANTVSSIDIIPESGVLSIMQEYVHSPSKQENDKENDANESNDFTNFTSS